MQKQKSSRAAVRNTPQPKAHNYIPVVFVDDYGRERALTVASAKSFSRKKLDAASRALERRADRAMDKAIRDGDRETGKAIRRLRKQEREADRSIARFFRRRIRTKDRPTRKIKHKPPKAKRPIWPYRSHALPKYDGPIRDRFNRCGVFFRTRYYSSRTAKPGVSKRVTVYIYKGSALDADGKPMVRTNVGLTVEETVCGLDHHEQVNRSAQKNAKVLNHAVLAMDYRWTPEQMLEVGERWAEERFGQYGLPYVVSLHEPPPDGDERNWHLHVIWSWRPLERVGDHEWLVGESLRTDLDSAQGIWLLRERFAAMMTQMSFEAGDADVYTALSHAARGLPVEPQTHLDEGRTRRAREGEVVEANEENHDRVSRSKAALADDELRREDERLARLQKIEQRVANRFTKVFTMPAIPPVALVGSKISATIDIVKAGALRLADAVPASAVPEPALQPRCEPPRLSQRVQDWIDSYRNKKFANLRISPSAAIADPITVPAAISRSAPLSASLRKTSVLRFASSIPVFSVPAKYISVPMTVPRKFKALRLSAASSSIRPPKSIAQPRTPTLTRFSNSALPALASKSAVSVTVPSPRFATASFSVLKPRSAVSRAGPLPDIISLPERSAPAPIKSSTQIKRPAAALPLSKAQPVPTAPLPEQSGFGSGVLSRLHPPAPLPAMNTTTMAELELTIARATAAAAIDYGDEQDETGIRERDTAVARAKAELKAREMLFDMLAEKRRIITKDKTGRWTVPAVLMEGAGLSPEQAEGQAVQQDLEREAESQRTELELIAEFLAPNPRRNLLKTDRGWRLTNDAPQLLRLAVFSWRNDLQIQDAFRQFASMPAIDKSDVNALRTRRNWFLSLVYGRSDDGDRARRGNLADTFAVDRGGYPPRGGGGGIGD